MGESAVAVDVVIALCFLPEPRIDAPLATATRREKERRQSRQTGGLGRLGHGTSRPMGFKVVLTLMEALRSTYGYDSV
ncbi:hypothetical protein B296_00002723 [Ensete ventricosum]|uniref:Uncharacterized protein n=1 Tax=Ensete ventricosum TaxID=4639 RepID=A0A427AUA3_ENSVE|nr:hypothetical protein B296_00002723 [Ensete ventricosum]